MNRNTLILVFILGIFLPDFTRSQADPTNTPAPAEGDGAGDRRCGVDEFYCGTIEGETKCITKTWKCDGKVDCPPDYPNDDEEVVMCTGCNVGEYKCMDDECIPGHLKCDRSNDCDMGEDESNCTYPACSQGFFTCADDRHCIPQSAVCDKKFDCGDKSDEADSNCDPTSTCNPDVGTFYCKKSKKCISSRLVCSGADDCGQNEDETGCGVDHCAADTNPCEVTNTCVNFNIGYSCSCLAGYQLQEDGHSCQDIDECSTPPYNCTQLCENSQGSYKCSCATGYIMDSDGKTCRADTTIEPMIVFANRYQIRTMDLLGNLTGTINEENTYAHVIDYDWWKDLLVYGDAADKQIRSILFNGSDEKVLVRRSIKLVEGLAVDWINNKLYWTDSGWGAVFVSNSNGTSIKTLHKERTQRPRAIVLHPARAYVFWTDWRLGAFIGRMGMDGSNMVKLIEKSLFWPNALTIDYITNTLWFADAHLDKIEMTNLDGTGRYSVIRGVAHVYGINIWEDTVYWTDWNVKKLYSANRYTGANRTELVTTNYQPYDIHVMHPLRQNKSIPNPCLPNNGGCSHLCLLSPGEDQYTPSYSCQCPDHFILNTDNKTCRADCKPGHFECKGSDAKCIPKRFVCDGENDCADGDDEPDSCPERHCDGGEFQCKTGSDCARQPRDLCDTVEDCGDGSDEAPDLCKTMECLPEEFKCNSGRCIPGSWKCDTENDCSPDGEDEDGCDLLRNCTVDEFACANGKCIPQLWFCDFDDDCGDRSDEPNGTVCHKECLDGWRKCATNYRCIPTLMFCDGDDDCRDNSDEDPEQCPKCQVGEFTCDDGQCIPLRWKCDFEEDCKDGSDESDCNEDDYRKCEEHEWRCKNHRCIRERYKCDHDDDCGDGSDELHCSNHTCHSELLQCRSGHCYSPDLKCDGTRHCLKDASDEENCPTRFPNGRYCADDKFQCDNTVCVNLDWICDMDDDCGDGSDENLELCKNKPCPPNTSFRCGNGYCISLRKVCDNNNDCMDGSDENNHTLCPPIDTSCESAHFTCDNKKCIKKELVCNDVNDCDDFSDEVACHTHNQGSCAVNNGGCERNCTQIGNKFYCHCPPGLKVDTNNPKLCIDVDECASWGNQCVQECFNTDGSFKCGCAENFNRTAQGEVKLCRGRGNQRKLLIALHSEIRQWNEFTGHYTDVIRFSVEVGNMDVAPWDKLVYWTAPSINAVIRGWVPEDSSQVSVPQRLQFNSPIKPEGIAYDWIAENIYVTDSSDGRIVVAKADGRYAATIVPASIRRPYRIALAPTKGIMVWIDSLNKKIESASMDGTNIRSLVTTDLREPTSIAIDHYMKNRIFWSDYKKNTIESVWLDGTDRVTVYSKATHHPLSLDVFESSLFWISQDNGTVSVLDKFARGVDVNHNVKQNLFNPKDVVVTQLYKQPKLPNPCATAGCSPLCVLVPSGTKCLCPDGSRFTDTGKSLCDTEAVEALKKPDPCVCLNGGSCVVNPINYKSQCYCTPDYTGDNCGQEYVSTTTTTTQSTTTTSTTTAPTPTPTTTTERATKPRSDGNLAIILPVVISVLLILIIIIVVVLLILYRRGVIGNKKTASGVFRPGPAGNLENGSRDPQYELETPAVHYDASNGGNASFVNPIYGVADKDKEKLAEQEYAEIPAKM